MSKTITKITILYDTRCGLCRKLQKWLMWQPAFIEIETLSMHSSEASKRFPSLAQMIKDDRFICVDNNGDVYVDEEARILCLWALKKFRRLSLQIANTPVKLLAKNFFEIISRNRHSLSSVLALEK